MYLRCSILYRVTNQKITMILNIKIAHMFCVGGDLLFVQLKSLFATLLIVSRLNSQFKSDNISRVLVNCYIMTSLEQIRHHIL